jgi:hypothetical protein
MLALSAQLTRRETLASSAKHDEVLQLVNERISWAGAARQEESPSKNVREIPQAAFSPPRSPPKAAAGTTSLPSAVSWRAEMR